MIEVTEAFGLSFAYPAGDQAVGRCLRDYGEFGRVGATLAAQLSTSATFIDVGANIGVYSLFAARTAIQVIAIEAQGLIVDLLRDNVARNKLENVEVIHAVAGEKKGTIQFPLVPTNQSGNFGAIGIGRWKGETVETPVITLDEIAPENTSFVKIDVEGYEPEVIAGSSCLIDEIRPYWLFEASQADERSYGLLDRFRHANYRLYWFYDPFVTPRAPKRPWTPNEPGDISILAAPASAKQPSGMVEIKGHPSWPTSLEGFSYLHAFGIWTGAEPPPSSPTK